MAKLRVCLFGGLAVTWDESPLPPIVGSTARSLFAYLLTYRDRPHTRDLLAGTFWPEVPDATARRRLSQALWHIRRALAPHPILQTEGDTIQLAPDLPLWLDVEQFQTFHDRGAGNGLEAMKACERCIGLYRGAFLAGYYDDWAVIERERMREMLLETLERLVVGYKRQGAPEHALRHARRLASEDPWRENAHREVMRLCHLLGRDGEAVQQFEICRQALAEGLGAEPSAETVAIAQEIARAGDQGRATDLPLASPPPGSIVLDRSGVKGEGADKSPAVELPLVGRGEERARLIGHVEALLRGLGGVVLVEGQAGVGKTRLLQTIAQDAEWRGAEVLWGAGRQVERPAPYAPLVEALGEALTALRVSQLAPLVEGLWLQVLAPLLPPLAALSADLPPPPALDPAQEQGRLVMALEYLLSGWTQVNPLLLVLEDLHWIGEDTLDLLARLAPRAARRGVLIVGSYRGTEAHTLPGVWARLQALDRAGVQCRLVLDGLDAEATGELVRRCLGMAGAAPLFEARLYRETEGNPLFVLETLRALHAEGLLSRGKDGRWRTPWDETTSDYAELPLPPAVEQTITRRLDALSPALRGTIEVAAVLGERFGFDLLCAAGDTEPHTLLAVLREMVQLHFLEETKRDYRFGHDKIRQVAYDGLDAGLRPQLHRRAAQALTNLAPDQLGSLAHHWTRGEVWDKAAGHHRQAGDRARAVYANAEAVEHYSQALDALERLPCGGDPQLRFQLLLAREAIYDLLGKRAAQAEDLAAMVALAEMLDAKWRGELALRRANHAEVTNDYPVAIAAAQQAIQSGQAAQDTSLEATGQLFWGRTLWRQGEFDAACSHFAQALALARCAALRSLEAKVLHALGAVCRTRGGYAPARQYHEQALRIWREIGDRRGEGMALNSLGIICRLQGDYASARQYHRQAAHISHQIGERRHEGAALHNLGLVLRIERSFDEATTYYQQALGIAREIGARQFEAYTLGAMGSILCAQGDYSGAKRTYEQSLRVKQELGDRPGWANTSGNLGVVFRALGDYATAESYFVQSLCTFREIGDQHGEAICLADLSLLCHFLGDDSAAKENAQQAIRLSQNIGGRGTQAEAWINLGRAELGLGHLAEASLAFHQAQDLLRELAKHYLEVLPAAGLAGVALAQGNLLQAQAHAEELLAYLRDHSLDGNYDPFWVHSTCYRVLHATQDPRAETVLTTAHDLLQERAAKIDDQALRRSSLEKVAAHREIVDAYQALQATPRTRSITVSLPRADAPQGRALDDDEYVPVTWTPVEPGDEAIADQAGRRRHRLLRLLGQAWEQGAIPRDRDVADALDVSLATLRRDVATLRAEGHILPPRRRSGQ